MDERYKVLNKIIFIGMIALYIMFGAYLALKFAMNNINPMLAGIYGVLVVVFLLGNIIIFLKNKLSRRYNQISVAGAAIILFLFGMNTDAEFINIALIVMLILLIPYFDKKKLNRVCILGAVGFTLTVISRSIKGTTTADIDWLCRTICVYLGLYTVWRIGGIAREFNEHAIGSIEEQTSQIRTMFDGMLDISQVVRQEADKSTEMVGNLYDATESVTRSMQEIVDSTTMTAQNIEEQNRMTQNIQNAIAQTSDRSKKMVDIATVSNESIQENMRVMEELQMQSKQIAETNSEVTVSMRRLQEKTKEVEEIAGMILGISSQTNLLALNASIESARAGEAGRGFAVVADQIRQLAEQTKQSTEEITRIINELNENANEVVESVEKSVTATDDQNQKIATASVAFGKLNEDMTILIDDINELDREIMDLSDSNNVIVDSISQLSAATEEVTANAEQVLNMSENNLEYSREVKASIETIDASAEEMKKFM